MSNFSSARYTVSLMLPERRLRSFIFTTEALRPDLLNSAFRTTSGSLPTMITLPTLTSCAVFMANPYMSLEKRAILAAFELRGTDPHEIVGEAPDPRDACRPGRPVCAERLEHGGIRRPRRGRCDSRYLDLVPH